MLRRRRAYLAAAIFATVGVGLASRKWPWILPAALGKYPGDVLWAQVVYWSVALLAPAASIIRVAAFALAIAYVDEFTQLYQAPWINQLRATTVGHLVLGTTFSWLDLLAYTAGIGLCSLTEAIIFKARARGHV